VTSVHAFVLARNLRDTGHGVVDEGDVLLLSHHLTLHDWHLRPGIAPNERADRTPRGYVAQHEGRLMLVNTSDTPWLASHGAAAPTTIGRNMSVAAIPGFRCASARRRPPRVAAGCHAMTPDPFALVARALRDLMAPSSDPEASPALDRIRTRNLLLDACGSDHRALVELLLSVGDDVRSSLVGAPRADDARWETRRAPLVHRLVATRYLQTDIARWLVDCWAFAVGLLARVPGPPSLRQVEAEASLANAVTPRDATVPARGSLRRRWPVAPSAAPAA
jgi:hypothetical protein